MNQLLYTYMANINFQTTYMYIPCCGSLLGSRRYTRNSAPKSNSSLSFQRVMQVEWFSNVTATTRASFFTASGEIRNSCICTVVGMSGGGAPGVAVGSCSASFAENRVASSLCTACCVRRNFLNLYSEEKLI